MVEVTDHQGIDRLEFGQQQREQLERVHGAQSVRGIGLRENLPEIQPEFRAPWWRRGQRRQHLLDAIFRGGAQAQAVRGHEMKGTQQHLGIMKRIRLLQVNQAIHDREVRIRQARAPLLKLPIQR